MLEYAPMYNIKILKIKYLNILLTGVWELEKTWHIIHNYSSVTNMINNLLTSRPIHYISHLRANHLFLRKKKRYL